MNDFHDAPIPPFANTQVDVSSLSGNPWTADLNLRKIAESLIEWDWIASEKCIL
jgi:hypothetical protein